MAVRPPRNVLAIPLTVLSLGHRKTRGIYSTTHNRLHAFRLFHLKHGPSQVDTLGMQL